MAALVLSACGGGGGGSAQAVLPSSGGAQFPGSGTAAASTATTAPSATPAPTPTPAPLPILSDTSTSTANVFLGSVCPATAALSCGNFASTLRHGIALGTTFAGWGGNIVPYMTANGMTTWPSQGTTPEVTWMPNNISFAAINSGQYDSYIVTQAQQLKALGYTVFLRPFHEFNGNWYTWGLPNQGASSSADTAFIAAWQRVVSIFHQQGATNVKFVWCFSSGALKYAQTNTWDNPAAAYPGDAYVDWIGFDGYNRGTNANPKGWKTFDQVMSAAYQLAVSISNNKPIAISEVASNEYGDGGSMKSTWVSQMFSELSSPTNPYPHVRLISWFEDDSTGYKYDTESTNPAYNSFVTSIRNTDANGVLYFRSNGSVLGNITTP